MLASLRLAVCNLNLTVTLNTATTHDTKLFYTVTMLTCGGTGNNSCTNTARRPVTNNLELFFIPNGMLKLL